MDLAKTLPKTSCVLPFELTFKSTSPSDCALTPFGERSLALFFVSSQLQARMFESKLARPIQCTALPARCGCLPLTGKATTGM